MSSLTEKALHLEVEYQTLRKEVEYYLSTALSFRYNGVSRHEVEGLVRDFGMESITEIAPLGAFSSQPSQMYVEVALEGIYAAVLKKMTAVKELLSEHVLEALESLSKQLSDIDEADSALIEERPSMEDTEAFNAWLTKTFSTSLDYAILNHPAMIDVFDYLFSGTSYFKEVNESLFSMIQKHLSELETLLEKPDATNADIESFKQMVLEDTLGYLESRYTFKKGLGSLLFHNLPGIEGIDAIASMPKLKSFTELESLHFDTGTDTLREIIDGLVTGKLKDNVSVDFSQLPQLPEVEVIDVLTTAITSREALGGDSVSEFLKGTIADLDKRYEQLIKKDDVFMALAADVILTYRQLTMKLIFDNVFCYAILGEFAYAWLSRTKAIRLAHQQ